jgi:2-amino-4-hydroxy-6-hydroxymethyldihydropteridine diphosphokinase
MATAYIALGANEGDRLANLERAVKILREITTVEAISPIYETEPMGYADQPWFLNAAARVISLLFPLELLHELQSIEASLGKATPFANGPRTLDLDLLLYDDLVQASVDLDLPHPRMHERRFVLTPLADIAADAKHPTMGKTIGELLAVLPVEPIVRKWGAASALFPGHDIVS